MVNPLVPKPNAPNLKSKIVNCRTGFGSTARPNAPNRKSKI